MSAHKGEKAQHQPRTSARSGTFPVKLHNLLCATQEQGPFGVISWRPDGRSFIIENKDRLVREILPLYFRLKLFTSFQRQLEIYNFKRIIKGPDKGCYWHEGFIRDECSSAHFMVRQGIRVYNRPGKVAAASASSSKPDCIAGDKGVGRKPCSMEKKASPETVTTTGCSSALCKGTSKKYSPHLAATNYRKMVTQRDPSAIAHGEGTGGLETSAGGLSMTLPQATNLILPLVSVAPNNHIDFRTAAALPNPAMKYMLCSAPHKSLAMATSAPAATARAPAPTLAASQLLRLQIEASHLANVRQSNQLCGLYGTSGYRHRDSQHPHPQPLLRQCPYPQQQQQQQQQVQLNKLQHYRVQQQGNFDAQGSDGEEAPVIANRKLP